MANIANVSGVRTGTQAFTQAYLSKTIVSTLFNAVPILAVLLAINGQKSGFMGIGNPNVGSLITKAGAAKAREKEIYGAEMYQPLIHSTANLTGDGTVLPMRGQMPTVGGGGGSGAVITATVNNNSVSAYTVVYGGSGYSNDGSVTATIVGGTSSGGGATATVTITGGAVSAVSVASGGTGYTSTPIVTIGSAGVSFDQHFTRPGTKWVERVDPILLYKKPIRRSKNLNYGASRSEKEYAIANLYTPAIDDARAAHLTWWSRAYWGLTSTNDAGPTSQSAEVWDNLQSIPSACGGAGGVQTNIYAMVDRSVTGNTWWNGNRSGTHVAAVLEDRYNEFMYTNHAADLALYEGMGFGPKVFLCGPSNFPTFMSQARQANAIVHTDGKMPNFNTYGSRWPIIQFNDAFVLYDPQCPDKLSVNPLTGSNFTSNAMLAITPEIFTVGFEPEAKFTVDEWFDLTQTNGGLDAEKTQIRTEHFMIAEAPRLLQYWENVG